MSTIVLRRPLHQPSPHRSTAARVRWRRHYEVVLTQLIQQGGDGVQDHLNGTFSFACIVLCLLGVVRCLKHNKDLHVCKNQKTGSGSGGGAARTMEAIIISWSASAAFFATSCSAELS